MTLFPMSMGNIKRDCSKDKFLEANEEPQAQCGFPPCQDALVEMLSPCQQISSCLVDVMKRKHGLPDYPPKH